MAALVFTSFCNFNLIIISFLLVLQMKWNRSKCSNCSSVLSLQSDRLWGCQNFKNCSKWLLREEQVLQISKNGSKSPNRPYRGGMQFVQPLSLTFMTGFGWNIAVCKWCRVLVRATPTTPCIFVTWLWNINQNNSKGGKTMMIIVSSLLPCNQDFTSSLLHKIWSIVYFAMKRGGHLESKSAHSQFFTNQVKNRKTVVLCISFV